MQPEPQPPAPAVVAVVVTCDPGPWFAEALESLGAQDYPNLSVLVIDAGSDVDPTPVVAGVLPHAYVRTLGRRVPFGAAADEVLTIVEGASHFLFCHDDVALAPDAITLLVEEAFRSNAGVTTPKYVQWDDPERLLAVGATTDRVAVLRDLVDPGELDQEQHDVVRDVLVAPGGATLVRSDLFIALGGYGTTVQQFGEDLDFSWRARVAGARITVVPAARVRHLQAIRNGERARWRSSQARQRAASLAETNRIRTLFTCYRWFDVAWALPVALSWMLGEAATRVLQGQPGEAWRLLAAFASAGRQPGALVRARHRVQAHRGAGDATLRQLQVRGNVKFRQFVSSRVDEVRQALPHRAGAGTAVLDSLYGDDLDETGEHLPPAEPVAPSGRRFDVAVIVIVLVVLLVGSRTLLGHELPAVAQLPNTSGGWGSLWRAWWSTWQPGGLGVAAPSSPALALLGLLATALFGAAGTLQHVVVLGALVVGPAGAYRAARWWGSRRAQVVALAFYAVVPLGYNALARGHWGGLLAYASAPWVLSYLGRLSGEIPFPWVRPPQVRTRLLGLGLLTAVCASVAPSWIVVVPVAGGALLVGSILAGRPAPGLRMIAASIVAAAVAFVLLFPWSASVYSSSVAALGPAVGPSGRLGFGDVLRFHTGPFGSGGFEWALLAAASLPLWVGREWRLAWAARLWVTAIAGLALAWAGSRGWIPAVPPEVALAPAAAALAGSAALGVVSFEMDLPGYRFGWRQLAASLAAVGLGLASLPFFAAAGGGRWKLPTTDASSVLAFLPDNHTGDYRVLWVGAPDAVPFAGRELHSGIAYGTSYDGVPGISDLWLTGAGGAAPTLAADLRLVEGRLTTKLGHLLAPAGVRYLVVPNHTAPSGSGGVPVQTPEQLLVGLGLQTDLQVIDVADPNYTVFQNAAWAPARNVLPPAAVAAAGTGSTQRTVQVVDLAGATPILDGQRAFVPQGSTVYLGSTRSARWRLVTPSGSVAPSPAFGWAMSFQVPVGSGPVEVQLAYHPGFVAMAGKWFEIVVWALAVTSLVAATRRRPAGVSRDEVADPAWFVPLSPTAQRRPRRPGVAANPGIDVGGEEMWADA